MNARSRGLLAASIAAAVGGHAGFADAAVYTATLSEVLTYADNATTGSPCNFTSSTATWTYDDVTGQLSQTGGLYDLRVATSLVSTLYRTSIAGLIMGNGAPASAESYLCTEGNFGENIGASICGNYTFGPNFVNESAASWGPGTESSRIMGGDDVVAGAQQSIASLDNMTTTSFNPVGGTLVLTNKTCTGTCLTLPAGRFNKGQQWTLNNLILLQTGANDDTIQARSGLATEINVLANDAGFTNPVTVSILAPPAHGPATVLNSPGNASMIRISYLPAGGYVGPDSLVYQVTDGVNTATATVNISVVAFQARDDRYVILRGSGGYFNITGNDVGFGPQVSVAITQYPALGSAYVYGSPCAPSCVYVGYSPYGSSPSTEYTDTFRYQVSDGVNTDTATVAIRVVPFAALDDDAVTGVGLPVTIQVAANDLGFGYPRTIGIFSNPQYGTAALGAPPYYGSSDSAVTYTPGPGFLGTDTFEYAIDDGTRVDTAVVTVRVFVDSDVDQIDDMVDNCLGAANNSQRDTDGDGYGNWCDADLTNDGRTNFADLAAFRLKFATTDPNADLDGNGLVNFADLARLKALFGTGPGPSANRP